MSAIGTSHAVITTSGTEMGTTTGATMRKLMMGILLGCAGWAGCESPDSGELFDAALLSDGRIAAVGYIGLDDWRRPSVSLLDAGGNLLWTRYLGSSVGLGGFQIGNANAVAVDGENRIYAAGYARPSDVEDVAVVAAFDPNGDYLWETSGLTDGSSEIQGIAAQGGDLYVTGDARSDGGPEATQGVLAAKLHAGDGSVAWLDVLEAHPDPLKVTTGVHVATSPLGGVGVTGVATAADGHADWLAAGWSSEGERLWKSLRRGEGDQGEDAGNFNAASEGVFDGEGNFFVAGTLHSGLDGSNADLVKYEPSGAVAWVRSLDAELPNGEASFDRAGSVAYSGGHAAYGGTTGAIANGWLIDESFVRGFDEEGGSSFESGFPGVAESGEEVFDIATDSDGNFYVAGTTSTHGYGKDLGLSKLDPSGAPVWSIELDGVDNILDLDRIERLLVGGDGSLIAVGKIDWSFGIHVATVIDVDAASGQLVWAYPRTLKDGAKIHVRKD